MGMTETPAEPIRVYADTSVYGGVFDDIFSEASRTFFDQVEAGRFLLVISALVEAEIEPAPMEVRTFFERVRRRSKIVEPGAAAFRLRNAYLTANIVSEQYRDDALHVPNEANGFESIAIHSPREVIEYEEKEDL